MSIQQKDLNDLLNEWTKNLEAAYGGRSTNKNECDHEFKEYIGFTDKYFYCEKCDAKSRDGIWVSEN